MKTSRISGGRVGVYMPDHPHANNRGYVLRYRIVVEKKLGRLLGSDEIVHHRNGDKTDDRPENLTVTFRSKHAKHHNLSGKKRLDYDKIRSLKEKGLGYKKIAKTLSCSREGVRDACILMKINNLWGR